MGVGALALPVAPLPVPRPPTRASSCCLAPGLVTTTDARIS
jgi:hypothetical protein